VQIGLGGYADFLAFRGGFGRPHYQPAVHAGPFDFFLLIMREELFFDESNREDRGKTFSTRWVFPFVLMPEKGRYEKIPAYYFSQLEVWAGVGIPPAFRVGINPLEAVDFLAGWTTLDFMDDDSFIFES